MHKADVCVPGYAENHAPAEELKSKERRNAPVGLHSGRFRVRTEVFAPNPQEILQARLQADACITRFELFESALNEIFNDRTAGV
jgi:hypothetical protein